MSNLTIIRGLPGTGKTKLAKTFDCFHIENDMFSIKNGEYCYSDDNKKFAIQTTKTIVRTLVNNGIDVVLSNVFHKVEDFKYYIELCNAFNVDLKVIKMVKEYGNSHNVPESIMQIFKDEFEDYNGEIIL